MRTIVNAAVSYFFDFVINQGRKSEISDKKPIHPSIFSTISKVESPPKPTLCPLVAMALGRDSMFIGISSEGKNGLHCALAYSFHTTKGNRLKFYNANFQVLVECRRIKNHVAKMDELRLIKHHLRLHMALYRLGVVTRY